DDKFIASGDANNFDGGASTAASHNVVSYAKSATGVTVDLTNTTGLGTSGGAAGDTFVNIQDLIGSDQDDKFIASNAANNFDGGQGVDTVSYAGTAGDNSINLKTPGEAATGNGFANGDTYVRIENVTGGSGNDTFYAGATANHFDGDGGNNTVDYSKSGDAFGVIVDLLGNTGAGNGAGNAALGDAGGDTYANIQNATGTNQDDIFIANNVANKFIGGGGVDTVSYAGTAGNNSIDLKNGAGTGTGFANGDSYNGIENATGSAGNDTFFASGAANRFDGDGGNNTVDYSNSTDAFGVIVDLVGNTGAGNGAGNAALGDAGGDTYANIQNVTGTGQNDKFIANGVANVFDGKGGQHNVVSYESSTTSIRVDLSTTIGTGTGGDAQGDTYANIQDAIGGSANDTFVAGNAANNFDGGGGSHNLVSYENSTAAVTVNLKNGQGSNNDAANDTYTNIQDATGGGGGDTFVGSTSANKFDGGAGSDTVDYSSATTAVTVNLSDSTIVASGDALAAGDTYFNMENIIGGGGNDILTGSAGGNSTFTGGAGGDRLTGLGTNNTASYKGSAQAVTIDLNLAGAGSGGDAEGDIFTDIQNVIGSSNNDLFYASADANKLDGGLAGTDTVSYAKQDLNASITSGVNVDLSTGVSAGTGNYAQGDTYVNIRNLIGTQYADTLKGVSGGGSTLTGGGGADVLIGQGFNGANAAATANTASYSTSLLGVTVDLVHGTGSGGDANGDTLSGIQNIMGTGDNDIFIIGATSGGAADRNTVDGGTGGVDTVSYANEIAAVTVDLSTATGHGYSTANSAVQDTLTHIQNAIGGSGNDLFLAGNANNAFDGGNGSDTVSYAGSTTGTLVDAAHPTLATTGVIVDLFHNTGSGHWATGDTYTSIENVIGSSGSDLFISDHSAIANKYDGGSGGSDTVSYEYSSTDVQASLAAPAGNTGDAAGDTYSHIGNLMGSAIDGVHSTLTGDGAANVLTAMGDHTINILNGGGASSGSDVLDGRLGGINTLNAGNVGDTIFDVSTDGAGNLASNIIAGGVHGSSAAGATATMKVFGIDEGIALNMHSFKGHADNLTVVDLKDGVNTDITIDYNDILALGKNSGGVNGTELTLNLDDHDSVKISDVAGENWKFYGNGDYVFYADSDPNNTHALATLHTRPTA
ncbi:MAG TPA: calcium-binding protein, partial [Herbaspirillum sp.]